MAVYGFETVSTEELLKAVFLGIPVGWIALKVWIKGLREDRDR